MADAVRVEPAWRIEATAEDPERERFRIELVGPGVRQLLGTGATDTYNDYYGPRCFYGFEVGLYATPAGLEAVQVDHSSYEYGGDEHPREKRLPLGIGPTAPERALLHRLNEPANGGDLFVWQLPSHAPYLEGAQAPALVDDFWRLEAEVADAQRAELFGEPSVYVLRVLSADGSAVSFEARRPLTRWRPSNGPWERMLSAGPIARWTRPETP